MIIEENVENLSDYECANLIKELIQRLKITSYGRGYKDGFNDGKESEFQRQVMVNAIKESKEGINDIYKEYSNWESEDKE